VEGNGERGLRLDRGQLPIRRNTIGCSEVVEIGNCPRKNGVDTSQLVLPSSEASVIFELLELPEVIIEDFGLDGDYQKVLRPSLDARWNAGGFLKSVHFSDDGLWIGRGPRR
jgi:hypothetical protein